MSQESAGPVSSESLLERVAEIEPIIREHGPVAEAERRLPDPVVDAMRDAGLYQMWMPSSVGGMEVDPITACRVFEEVSRIDSAAGWNLQIAVLSSLFVALVHDEGVAQIFGNPDVIVRGVAYPPFRAHPVDGGYRVTGRMPFVSGCHHADWLVSPAHVMANGEPRVDGSGQPETIVAWYPAKDVEIINNWNTLGMRGTGSHDVAVNDKFVPEHLTGPLRPLENLGMPFDGPLYRHTVWPETGAVASVPIGIARAAIDELLDLAGAKTPALMRSTLRDRPVVQSQVAQAEAKLGAARAYLYEVFREIWDDAVEGHTISIDQKMRVQLASTHAAFASAEAVDLVHSAAGTSGIRDERQFERHFRDVHVITQHAFVSASRFESVGKTALRPRDRLAVLRRLTWHLAGAARPMRRKLCSAVPAAADIASSHVANLETAIRKDL